MNSLIERVKSAMVGLGTGWILMLMLVLSVISLAIMLERAWLYWSLRDDIEALMRDLGRLLRGGDLEGARRRLEESRSAEAAVVVAGWSRPTAASARPKRRWRARAPSSGSSSKSASRSSAPSETTRRSSGCSARSSASSAAFDELSKVKMAARRAAASQLAPEAVMARHLRSARRHRHRDPHRHPGGRGVQRVPARRSRHASPTPTRSATCSSRT